MSSLVSILMRIAHKIIWAIGMIALGIIVIAVLGGLKLLCFFEYADQRRIDRRREKQKRANKI